MHLTPRWIFKSDWLYWLQRKFPILHKPKFFFSFMCLNSYLRGVAKTGESPALQATRCCGMRHPPANRPLRLPSSAHHPAPSAPSPPGEQEGSTDKSSAWEAALESLTEQYFFLIWVGEKVVFFFQFCHYFNSQSLWSNGSGNWGCWLGALTAARRGTYCSPSPDVAQGQLDGETCLNLTVIPLTLWGKSARRCCWMSQQKA